MTDEREGGERPEGTPAPGAKNGRRSLWDGLLALPVVVALLPLLRGWPRGHDWSHELVKIAEFGHALGSGQLPPHWAENLYGGFGSTVFLFYAPAYAALASLAGALLGSVPRGGLCALAAFTVLGAFAIYRTAVCLTGGRAEAGRVATAVFVLHSYVIGDALLRSATSEYAALCVMPLALWGVFALPIRPRGGAALLAVSLGLTVVTHNITALVTFGIVAAAGVWLHRSRGDRRAWPWLGLGLGLALSMSVFFWLPALSLKSLVQTDAMITGRFDFHENFPTFGSLFGYSRFFGAGWLAALILIASLREAVRSRQDSAARPLRFLVAVASVLIVLMTPLSTVVWEHAPLLPYLQFPWRLQGPLAVVTALLAACVFATRSGGWPRARRNQVEAAVLALVLANALPHLLAAQPLRPEERAWAERGLTPDALKAGVYKASVLDEYLPASANLAALAERSVKRGQPVVAPPGTVTAVHEDTGSRILIDVATSPGSWLTLERWSFPGWEARADGRPAPTATDSLGRLRVQVEAGAATLEIVKRAPLVRRVTLAVSGAAFLLWIGLALTARRDGHARG